MKNGDVVILNAKDFDNIKNVKCVIFQDTNSRNCVQFSNTNNELPKDNWVPVSDYLPEQDERYNGRKIINVLVSTTNGTVHALTRRKRSKDWSWSGRIFSDIIAWQPLPESYKGE